MTTKKVTTFISAVFILFQCSSIDTTNYREEEQDQLEETAVSYNNLFFNSDSINCFWKCYEFSEGCSHKYVLIDTTNGVYARYHTCTNSNSRTIILKMYADSFTISSSWFSSNYNYTDICSPFKIINGDTVASDSLICSNQIAKIAEWCAGWDTLNGFWSCDSTTIHLHYIYIKSSPYQTRRLIDSTEDFKYSFSIFNDTLILINQSGLNRPFMQICASQ
jgi:hypothetical protein